MSTALTLSLPVVSMDRPNSLELDPNSPYTIAQPGSVNPHYFQPQIDYGFYPHHNEHHLRSNEVLSHPELELDMDIKMEMDLATHPDAALLEQPQQQQQQQQFNPSTLPMITPPQMDFAAFQFPATAPSGHQAQQSTLVERTRSRSNTNGGAVHPSTQMHTRRLSHHHLSTPPPPLSSRLQQSLRHASGHQPAQRRLSEFDIPPYHPYAVYMPPPSHQQQQLQGQGQGISPLFIYDSSSTSASTTPSSSLSELDFVNNTVSNGPTTTHNNNFPSRRSSQTSLNSASSSSQSQSLSIYPAPPKPNTPGYPLSASSTSSPYTPFTPEGVAPATAVGEEDEDEEVDRPWDLVPYHVPWGSSYIGYKAGTLPGPEGKSLFLRSPTPTKNQRTTQACEKCRERKAKCSGTRPACVRCVTRGHVCEYGPAPAAEVKKKTSSTFSVTSSSGGDRESSLPPSPLPTDLSEAESTNSGGFGVGRVRKSSPAPLSAGAVRPSKRLPDRDRFRRASARASVPNLRARAAGQAQALAIAKSARGTSPSDAGLYAFSPLSSSSPSAASGFMHQAAMPPVPPSLLSSTVSAPQTMGHPKLRAPVPLSLHLNIPAASHLSFITPQTDESPLLSSSSISLAGSPTGSFSSIGGFGGGQEVELIGQHGHHQVEMVTPAPATAMFFQDQHQHHSPEQSSLSGGGSPLGTEFSHLDLDNGSNGVGAGEGYAIGGNGESYASYMVGGGVVYEEGQHSPPFVDPTGEYSYATGMASYEPIPLAAETSTLYDGVNAHYVDPIIPTTTCEEEYHHHHHHSRSASSSDSPTAGDVTIMPTVEQSSIIA